MNGVLYIVCLFAALLSVVGTLLTSALLMYGAMYVAVILFFVLLARWLEGRGA